MASKFSEKAKAIHFDLPSVDPAARGTTPQDASAQRPRTAVGSHVDALYRDRALADEAERLRARLTEFDGALPTKRLDPGDVVLSRFANRHPDSFRDSEFVALKAEIEAAGGNTQPIGVRPLPGAPGKYELSFGSRRRQACLELGLPVLALIEEMDEATLFERMERENRQRKNLRPYEQGMLYRRALDEKLFPSQRKLAEHLQIDSTGLSRLLAVANLPGPILDAFESPLDIQFDWGAMINDAMQVSPDAVLAKAAELKVTNPKKPKLVLQQLLRAAGVGGDQLTHTIELRGANGQVATLAFGKKTTSIKITGLPFAKRPALEAALQNLLG